jgi:hypothetical protein
MASVSAVNYERLRVQRSVSRRGHRKSSALSARGSASKRGHQIPQALVRPRKREQAQTP